MTGAALRPAGVGTRSTIEVDLGDSFEAWSWIDHGYYDVEPQVHSIEPSIETEEDK